MLKSVHRVVGTLEGIGRRSLEYELTGGVEGEEKKKIDETDLLSLESLKKEIKASQIGSPAFEETIDYTFLEH